MKGEGVSLLRGGGDGEGMPLKVGNGGNVEVDIVPGLEVEVGGSLDDEIDNFGWEHNSSHHVTLSFLTPGLADTEEFLKCEHRGGADKPFPKIWSVNNQQNPKDYVEKVSPIKHLKMSRVNLSL